MSHGAGTQFIEPTEGGVIEGHGLHDVLVNGGIGVDTYSVEGWGGHKSGSQTI